MVGILIVHSPIEKAITKKRPLHAKMSSIFFIKNMQSEKLTKLNKLLLIVN
tara:strand:- start:398 stop:550 length:153 start_codon:yes stop_codon:yes gene_type:complete